MYSLEEYLCGSNKIIKLTFLNYIQYLMQVYGVKTVYEINRKEWLSAYMINHIKTEEDCTIIFGATLYLNEILPF